MEQRLEKIASLVLMHLFTENKVIPDNSLVVGSPGKIVRQVSSEEVKLITENAIHYQENWKKYSKSVF